jgi:uncharacterized damage-inducible protein DinB
MIGRPERTEAAPYYFTYIDQIIGNDGDGDILGILETQTDVTTAFLRDISEEKSLYRYAPGKWSIRQTWSHVNDAERIFVSRALWFARGFEAPLPSFDQEVAVAAAGADTVKWASHVEEFRQIRMATVALFRNLPADAWLRRGTASGNVVSVRALAYLVAGHAVHHMTVLRERYLQAGQEPAR